MKKTIALIAGTVGLGIGIYYLIQGLSVDTDRSAPSSPKRKTNSVGENHIRGVMHKVKVQSVS